MANPPIENRRPGVDASIVQADWVRGYDAPASANPPQVPCDLLISNGEDQVNGDVSDILIWNRTDDREQPMFIMLPGDDSTTAPRFNVHAGDLADPNGIITSPIGSLYVSNNPAGVYQNTDGATTWVKISDDLGGENLAETLAIGNFTGGLPIILTKGDELQGEADASGLDGGDVILRGGAATGAAGDGGGVQLISGTSVSGNTGDINLITAVPSGASASGPISVGTGGTTGGGDTGNVTLFTGNVGAAGIGGNAGDLIFNPGDSNTTGLLGTGGHFIINGGGATTDGQAGYLRMLAGSTVPVLIPFPIATPGAGGEVRIVAGSSAQAVTGAAARLQAGGGGPLGGVGGNVNLVPGLGGGGADDGQVVAQGVFRSDNIKRGTGDPNVNNIDGDEGDIYQRLDGGDGQLWLNVLGGPNGWQRMALSGDFISSWQQMQWGYISPVAVDTGGTDNANVSDLGIYESVQIRTSGGAGDTDAAVSSNNQGLRLDLVSSVQDSVIGLDSVSVGSGTISSNQRFLALFRMQPEPSVGFNQPPVGTYFFGFSSNGVTSQVTNSTVTPAAGNYFGFALSPSYARVRIVSRQSASGLVSNLDTTLGAFEAGGSGYYYAIDATDFSNGIRFVILDDDIQVVFSTIIPTAGNTLPVSTATMGACIGCTLDVGAPNVTLRHYLASITTNADLVAQGSGPNSNLSLAQVLVNGNNTGANFIEVQHSRGLIGETDGNAGAGASYSILSGSTTGAALNTGNLTIVTASQTVAAASGDSGSLLLGTGAISNAASTGDTGALTVGTGVHGGVSGTSGTILIASGAFTTGGVGATTGDILIAPGTFGVNPANPGLLDLRGGSTSLAGVNGGNINIQTGSATGASGSTGALLFSTPNVNQNGNGGTVFFTTGDGGVVSGTGGSFGIILGDGPAGNGGGFAFDAGDGGNGVGGGFLVNAGDSTVGNGADITLNGGDTVDAGADGGSIIVTPGSGGANAGQFLVNGDAEITGKLTVGGSIDPDAVGFKGVLANPLPINPGTIDGVIWVDTNAVPSKLVFTDSLGANTDLGSGGATSLNDLTDVTIAGPLAGQVLTFNGVDWVNLAGFGGSPLSTILTIGNTTGGTDIEVSSGDQIVGADDLLLNPGGGAGDQIVLEGLRWPKTDGLANYVLTTDGAGNLTFQPGGGGGGGTTFPEAFTRMQWGSIQATTAPGNFIGDGIFQGFSTFSAGPASLDTAQGAVTVLPTLAVPADNAGIIVTGSKLRLDQLPFMAFHFDGSGPIVNMRYFVGLTTAGTLAAQVGVAVPAESFVGIQAVTDAPFGDTTLHFVTDNNTGTPTTIDTGVDFTASVGFWLLLDATTAGQVILTLLDDTGAQISTTTFAANIPTATLGLNPMIAVDTILGAVQTVDVYNLSGVTRADLLNALAGGSLQDLSSVLTLGNETGGTPIKGDDNAGGSGTDLDLQGGTSTGGGGAGGSINFLGGAADPAGIGAGGGFVFSSGAPGGAGAGNDGGSFQVALANGDGTGGDGGGFQVQAGSGNGSGQGGDLTFAAGTGGGTAGAAGRILFTAGNAGGGNAVGGNFEASAGDGLGTQDGGAVIFATGDALGTGDGGNFEINLGTGGTNGSLIVNGDAHITGKLTVDGLIDPPGLLMSSSVSAPFAPAGFEGGIWVNSLGELVFTNTGGDLNLSTAIGGGMSFLDGLLQAAYGFMGPGNSGTPLQSYGVLGGGVSAFTNAGATIVFGGVGGLQDPDGPLLNLMVAAAATSEAYCATSDALVRPDMRFKAVFKFQVNSPAQADQRIFIGFTDDPTTQVSSADDPAANQYVGIRQDLAGFNFDFVGRGSGGALVPVLAIPTDALVHYLTIDTIDGTNLNMQILAADGITAETPVFTVALATLTVPDVTLPLYSQIGIYTDTGTTPLDVDFYFHSVVTGADIIDQVTGGGSGGTPPLENVLLAGNTTGATDILVTAGQAVRGETTTLVLSGAQAAGLGVEGTITLSENSTDDGGDVAVAAGDGGGGAGVGGSTTITAGAGSSAGGGGVVTVRAGDGGATGGLPGAVTIRGGDAIFGGQDAGGVILRGGDATGGDPVDRGGTVQLVPGASTAPPGGSAGGILIGVDGTLTPVDGAAGSGIDDGGNGSFSFTILGAGGDNLTGNAGDGGDFRVTGGAGGNAAQGVSPATAGTATDFIFTGAAGGTATHATGNAIGGAGSQFNVTLDDGGGGAGDTAATGGLGGGFTLIGGSGGNSATATSGTSASGAGGDLSFTLGSGGDAAAAAVGTATAGFGGSLIVALGSGGDAAGGNVAGTAGDGGSVTVGTGAGGDSSGADNAGGAGGSVAFTLGSGGDGTGTEDGGDGGSFLVVGGNAGNALGAGTEGGAGDVVLTAGAALTTFSGFSRIQGGGGPPTAAGGAAEVAGGDIGAAPSFGAFFLAGAGGEARVRGGSADGSANGGLTRIVGGQSGPGGAAVGGDVVIIGGGGISVTGDGGDVRIEAAASVGGSPGQLEINSQTRINGSGFKHGTFTDPAWPVGPGTTTYLYGGPILTAYTPFPVIPGAAITISFTTQFPAPLAAPFPQVTLVGAPTATGFTLSWDIPPPPGTILHWTARLS